MGGSVEAATERRAEEPGAGVVSDLADEPLRLAIFSPVPPAPSGIADYLLDLLPLLPRAWRMDLFVDEEVEPDEELLREARRGSSAPGCFPEAEFHDRQAAARYDLNIYQLGNASARVPTFRIAREHPGLLVLHDCVLHPARAHRALEAGELDLYRQEAEACRGDVGKALGHLVAGGLAGPELFVRFPMCEDLVRASRVTGVHGELACGWLRAMVPGARVMPLTHWRSVEPVDEAERRAWRGRLLGRAAERDRRAGETGMVARGGDGAEETVLIGSFGAIGVQRRLERVLEALAAVDSRLAWRFVVVGAVDPVLRLEEIAAGLGVGERVSWLGRVGDADFAALVQTVDLAVNLRYPPARASSGVLHQLLQAGVPTVISDVIHWREYPGAAVERVPPGPDAAELEALVAALDRWIGSAAERRQASEAARSWAAAELTPQRMAASYVAAVEASLVSSGEA